MAKPRLSDTPQISPKQLQVLKEIARQASLCYSATIGELAQALNISRPTVFEHIAALRRKNLLIQSAGRARSLHLTPAGEKLLSRSVLKQTVCPDAVSDIAITDTMPGLTLRGRVSAGYGIEAVEEQTPFSLGELFNAPNELFVLQVTGRSMINAGIEDGDFVMCRSARVAENGQLVVALLDDHQSATLKRFYKDDKAVRLQPENDAFEPIISTDCSVQAVVIGLIRKFKSK